MHSKQVRSRWRKIPIGATVIITLRTKEKKTASRKGESGGEEPGKEQSETRSNGHHSKLRGLGGEGDIDKNEESEE